MPGGYVEQLFERAFHWYSKIITIVISSRVTTQGLQVCPAHGHPHFYTFPTADRAFALYLAFAHHAAQFYITLERAAPHLIRKLHYGAAVIFCSEFFSCSQNHLAHLRWTPYSTAEPTERRGWHTILRCIGVDESYPVIF